MTTENPRCKVCGEAAHPEKMIGEICIWCREEHQGESEREFEEEEGF